MWDGWTGIDFLNTMQEMRESLPDVFSKFFETISSSVVYLVLPLLISSLLLWFGNKKSGEFFALSAMFGIVVADVVKFFVKQPRPWVLDPSITPSEQALEHSGGYSFPSAHSSVSVAGYGSAAIIARKRIWLSLLCVVLICLIVFARLFLGVHTPIDVIFGSVLGLIVLIVNAILLNASYKSDKSYNIVGEFYLVAAVLMILLIEMNLDQNYLNTRLSEGFLLGFVAGRLLEHNFVGYTPAKTSAKSKVLFSVLGLLVTAVIVLLAWKIIRDSYVALVFGFIATIWITVVFPYILKWKDEHGKAQI